MELPHNSHSRSIVEGTKESLERLGLDYVDVIFAHRPDVSGNVFAIIESGF